MDRRSVTLVLLHHTRKTVSEPYAPPELQHIAWSGTQEFMRQWLLLSRREKYQPGSGEHQLWLSAGGSAGHNGMWALDVNEGKYDGETPRCWDVEVRGVTDAKLESQRAKERRRAEWLELKEAEHRHRLLDAVRRFPDGETARVLRETAGVNNAGFGIAVRSLLKEGRVTACQIRKQTGTYDGYKPTGK